MAAALVIGALGGRWLDGKLGSRPWLMLVGLCTGLVVSLYQMVQAGRKARDASRTQQGPP